MKNKHTIKFNRTRQQLYDSGQHALVCKDLCISSDPDSPGPTAHEAVTELIFKLAAAHRLLSCAIGCIALTDETRAVSREGVHVAKQISSYLKS